MVTKFLAPLVRSVYEKDEDDDCDSAKSGNHADDRVLSELRLLQLAGDGRWGSVAARGSIRIWNRVDRESRIYS